MGGVFSVFVPQGAVGILAGVFLLVLIAVVTGQAEGVWLAMALVAFGLLAVLMVRAIRRDLRRDDRRPARREATLPDDSQLSDEERREAMQRYRGRRPGRPVMLSNPGLTRGPRQTEVASPLPLVDGSQGSLKSAPSIRRCLCSG
jgi:hypothetical protein